MTDIDNLLARLDDKYKWLTIPTHDVIEMVSEAAAVIRALRAEVEKPAALPSSTDISRIIEARVRLAP